MTCVRISDGFLCLGGPDRTIAVNGQRYEFEMHPRFGPMLLTKTGAVADRQPGGRHPFWKSVTLWAQQGERVDAEGLCVWEPETPPEVVNVGGVWVHAASAESARRTIAGHQEKRAKRKRSGSAGDR